LLNEDELYSLLLEEKRQKHIKIRVVDIDIDPNYKIPDSPDFILIIKLKLKLEIFSREFDIRIPIPIELEKVGADPKKENWGALEDLRKFIERKRRVLEIPMIVISKYYRASFIKYVDLKTRIKVIQMRSSDLATL